MFTKTAVFFTVMVFLTSDAARVRKQGLKHFRNYGIGGHVRRNASANFGLWPSAFNLATKALISANATCGEGGREEFCRMVEGGKGRCGICDNFSSDPGKKHPISYAIDGTNKWWQSPPLFYGKEYEYVTINIDLKQVYQIAYVIVKSANSPRPGTWILERSLDDEEYEPWQYFARSDKECLERYGVAATKGKPHYFTDSEVICTSFYSRLTPMENGEIHTSLVNGRPGANETSPELLEFTKARYVRLRLMGLRGTVEPLPRWFSQDINRDKRLYYTIRDISIVGQCVCNGHAENCRHNVASGHPECECGHHTCGPNCERCCPMFNQRQWGPGSSRDARQCLPCNCHGHATSCHYDENVDRTGLSMDINGNYQGGGVCDNCTNYTTGINCEQCIPGYYRPPGTPSDAEKPCLKCDCDPDGSTGICIREGKTAGTCDCLPGYMGRRCDSCAPGYRGWPKCEACPCDPKGTVDLQNCEGECICKGNVDGKLCDRCKSGHFDLRGENPSGCTTCYCSDVTTLCDSVIVKPNKVQTLNDWLMTDLKVTEVAKPSWDDKGVFSLGSYELSDVESLYWLAPGPYSGNKLEFYGSIFTFKVHWVIMRGDTSGKPTTGPNIILVGANGLKIAYGNDFYTASNMTFEIKLSEDGWYLIPPEIRDIVTRLKRTEYKGDPVNRRQFLSVLSDIKHVLLRATFHTDQIEALLEVATMEVIDADATVEKCSCPSGYTGLSCESCAFGHVRIMSNTTNDGILTEQGFCGKCDCNGHSESCNPDTGECFCQHNTVGETCERCKPSFYGNPLKGREDDCKKCACPLENDENNFSPSCQLDYLSDVEDEEGGYVCTQCPKGYTGDHCEVCDDGWFGNPMEVGNNCKPCNCNGGPCDPLTGQCLSCKGNTEGWRCDRCKPGFYRDASTSNCISCQCDPVGTISKNCHNETGQCDCRERFTGRTCDKCEMGYGNVTGLCTPCSCNPVGSKSDVCDQHTGLCKCRKGVEGFHCDACQNSYYGFSEEGCQACSCDPEGSLFQTCDEHGQCRCKEHFAPPKCESCEPTFWKDGSSCVPCDCDVGAQHKNCDPSGFCLCKVGVGGEKCNVCLPKYYGNVTAGCKKCDTCDKIGHICDERNGKCVCPPYTVGETCGKCKEHAWGYEPGVGCKPCNCSLIGSLNRQCNLTTGACEPCRIGYGGEKCDRCSYGFYETSKKKCEKCNCHHAGTLAEDCTPDSCQCMEGRCRCKAKVTGNKCDGCKPGTFGVSKDNPEGCTDCFCFGRSKKCRGAELSWDQIRSDELEQDFCEQKPCLKLPKKFSGDLTTSYGGYLRMSSNSALPLSYKIYITGNGITLEASTKNLDVQIVESAWKIKHNANPTKLPNECFKILTRPCFMVVLQNVAQIHVESGPTLRNAEIHQILLDVATSLPSGSGQPSLIELCQCPKEYTSASCQDPSEGYYRHYPKPHEAKNYIDSLAGIALPCQCSGRSDICDKQTGHCLNCKDFTSGPHCEFCAEGYYKDSAGNCSPCLCPTAKQNNAVSCKPGGKYKQFVCECKKGYTGARCEKCDEGHWGTQELCQACSCNPHGSESSKCDRRTGKCVCKAGFNGTTCSECFSPREIIQNGVCTPCDECTQILFNTIDQLDAGLKKTLLLFKDGLGPPWPVLNKTFNEYDHLYSRFKHDIDRANEIIKLANISGLENRVDHMKNDLNSNNQILSRQVKSIDNLHERSTTLTKDINELKQKIDDIIRNLDGFGNSHIDTQEALRQAKIIVQQIKQSYETMPTVEDYNNIFDQCDRVLKKVAQIYQNDLSPDLLKSQLKDLKHRLSSLNKILNHAESDAKLVKHKNKQNSKKIKELQQTINNINHSKHVLGDNISDLLKKINNTNDILVEIKKIYDTLKKVDLIQSTGKIQGDIDHVDDLYDVLDEVAKHIKDLQNEIGTYKTLFNFTNDEWKKINASGAYNTLEKRLDEAMKTALAAKELVNETVGLLQPKDDKDSLLDKTNIAKYASGRLKQRVMNLKKPTEDFKKIQEELERLKYDILSNGRNNNELITFLIDMKSKLDGRAEEIRNLDKVEKAATNISDIMNDIEKKVKNLNISAQFDLMKPFYKYLNLTSNEEISKLKDQNTLIAMELNKLGVKTNITTFDKLKELNANKIQTDDLESFDAKLKSLKDKIQYATEAAQAINLAISISNCRRTYKINTGVFEFLKVTYKCLTCNLLTLKNSKNQKISLNVVDNKIKLTWLSNIKEIPLDKNADINTVGVRRVGSRIFLDSGGESQHFDVQEVYNIDDEYGLTIGGSSQTNEGACLHEVMLNDETLGLWKFKTTQGNCTGCYEKNVDGNDVQVFFNGIGYVNATKARNELNAGQWILSFSFATFDEGSLLFLAQNQANCSFILLNLVNGYLNLNIQQSNGKRVLLKSDQKLNDGSKRLVEIKFQYNNTNILQSYTLKVGQSNVTETTTLPRGNVFRIKQSEIFIGGIPSIFNKTCLRNIVTPGFLGFLTVESQQKFSNPQFTTSFGTTTRKDELQLNKAWFMKNGHLDLNISSHESIKSVGFLLKSDSSNAQIMRIGSLQISIENGRLITRNEGTNVEHELNGGFNEITLKFSEKKIEVNSLSKDVKLDSVRPMDLIQLGDGSNNQNWGISNIVINNELFPFNSTTVRNFEKVEIGRAWPESRKVTTKSIPDASNMKESMQNAEGCATFSGYETDPDAVKFGDKLHSYVFIENAFWKKDYVLEFYFRTFYPNGLLFISTGVHDQKHYNVLEIREGKLKLRVKGKRQKVITVSNKINDGEWHQVQIKQAGLKKKRKLTITVDGVARKPARMPKNNVKGELYVGGVPEEFHVYPDLRNELHPFRGCIRSLKINNHLQILVRNKKNISYNNIGQCFQKDEIGAYFGGAAFAIYKADFKLNKVLELSFEFRTAEQNGILLSVSNYGNSPALSVELQSGAVVMTIDMGNGAISNVTNNLDSDFTLCNNRWHNLTALYSSSELTVNVDGIRKSWVQSDVNSLMDEIEAPLYVGGLPDSAPTGTLKFKENFKGCIRNLKIEDNLMDWTDMKELNNVLLNSCPVVNDL